MTEHQLQAGGGRMLLSAIWRIYEESQVLLKGAQQGLNKWVVGLVGEVHKVLIYVNEIYCHITIKFKLV